MAAAWGKETQTLPSLRQGGCVDGAVRCRGCGEEHSSGARLPGPNPAQPLPSCVTKQVPNSAVRTCPICEMKEMVAPTHVAAIWKK